MVKIPKWLPSLHAPGHLRVWRIGYALVACFALAFAGLTLLWWLALVLLHHPALPRSHVISVHDTVGVAQLVFASVAGVGALVALVMAYRRQRVAEDASSHDRTRMLNERFTAIAAQLGDAQPAVRLAGVHAMAGLADDWKENRQTCVDVLCAYLRLPYDSDPGEEAAPADRAAYRANREVRHTVIRLIGAHLCPGHVASWEGLNLDFTGVIFDGGDFSGARFSGGIVRFDGASFVGGEVSFDGGEFTGGKVSFRSAEFSGGKISFSEAEFSGGKISFSEAKFSGGKIYFGGEIFGPGAVFSGGEVDFDGAVFSDSWVSFNCAVFSSSRISFFHTKFSGSHVRFHRGEFSGGWVSFNGTGFSGGEVRFSEAKFSGSMVGFDDAGFEGGEVSFRGNMFSGGEVSFVGGEFTGGTVSFRGNRFSGGVLGLSAPGVWSRPPEVDFDWEHPPPGVKLPSETLLRELESLDTDTTR